MLATVFLFLREDPARAPLTSPLSEERFEVDNEHCPKKEVGTEEGAVRVSFWHSSQKERHLCTTCGRQWEPAENSRAIPEDRTEAATLG